MTVGVKSRSRLKLCKDQIDKLRVGGKGENRRSGLVGQALEVK
jgi:hypothetical protein